MNISTIYRDEGKVSAKKKMRHAMQCSCKIAFIFTFSFFFRVIVSFREGFKNLTLLLHLKPHFEFKKYALRIQIVTEIDTW